MRSGKRQYLAVGAEEVCELVDGRDIADLLCGDVFSSVESRENIIVLAAFDGGNYFFCVHCDFSFADNN